MSRQLRDPTFWDQNTDPESTFTEQIHKEVISFSSFVTPILAEELTKEVKKFLEDSKQRQQPVTPPTIFCQNGAILSEIDGLDQALSNFVKVTCARLGDKFFPHLNQFSPNDYLAAVTIQRGDSTTANTESEVGTHSDDSCATLNICLSSEFTGGELTFTSDKQQQVTIPQTHCSAVFHLGATSHTANPTTLGERVNLIVWLVSNKKKATHKQPIMRDYVRYLSVLSGAGQAAFDVPTPYFQNGNTTVSPRRRPTPPKKTPPNPPSAKFVGGEQSTRAIVSIHIGKVGCNLGSSWWELAANSTDMKSGGFLESTDDVEELSRIFRPRVDGSFSPRAIFCDVGADETDRIKQDWVGTLLDDGHFGEDHYDVLGLGAWAKKRAIGDEITDTLRQATERCSSFQGVLLHRALGGSVGAAVGRSFLEDCFWTDFPKKTCLAFNTFPSTKSESCLNLYNWVLSMTSASEYCDVNFMWQLESVLGKGNKQDTQQSSKEIANQTIARGVFGATRSLFRPDAHLNVDLNEFVTNMIPYPQVNFLSLGHSNHGDSVTQIALDAILNPWSRPRVQNHKFFALSLLFHGNVVPKDIMSACGVIKTRRSIEFVDWMASGFKSGCCWEELPVLRKQTMERKTREVTSIANTTGVSELVSELTEVLFDARERRLFLHHYYEQGVEDGEFEEGMEWLCCLGEKEFLLGEDSQDTEGSDDY